MIINSFNNINDMVNHKIKSNIKKLLKDGLIIKIEELIDLYKYEIHSVNGNLNDHYTTLIKIRNEFYYVNIPTNKTFIIFEKIDIDQYFNRRCTNSNNFYIFIKTDVKVYEAIKAKLNYDNSTANLINLTGKTHVHPNFNIVSPTSNITSIVYKGGKQFINVPKFGKRKIRFQKNGKAYVIVKGKKLKLNKII